MGDKRHVGTLNMRIWPQEGGSGHSKGRADATDGALGPEHEGTLLVPTRAGFGAQRVGRGAVVGEDVLDHVGPEPDVHGVEQGVEKELLGWRHCSCVELQRLQEDFCSTRDQHKPVARSCLSLLWGCDLGSTCTAGVSSLPAPALSSVCTSVPISPCSPPSQAPFPPPPGPTKASVCL